MPLSLSVVTGPGTYQDGAQAPVRGGRSGEAVVQELHGRFYESNYRGNVYSGGMGLTAINNATYTTGTLSASVTPIAGVYNPIGSPVNLVILQAALGLTMTSTTATGGGPYVWAAGITTTAITASLNAGFNRKTLQASGGWGKDITNTAPTGLTPSLTVRFGSALGGGSATNQSFVATAVAMQTQLVAFVENFDGGLIVPPGGVLALLATTTPVAHSAVSAIVWEEVAL